jgi:hypothetical protein
VAAVTPAESAIVRDLQARLRLAHEQHKELEYRIRYLERDKKSALTRTRKALDQARYWYGVSIGAVPPPGRS